jgi:hypothetical protein
MQLFVQPLGIESREEFENLDGYCGHKKVRNHITTVKARCGNNGLQSLFTKMLLISGNGPATVTIG